MGGQGLSWEDAKNTFFAGLHDGAMALGRGFPGKANTLRERSPKGLEDFLRTRHLPLWDKEYRLAQRFRPLNRTLAPPARPTQKPLKTPNPDLRQRDDFPYQDCLLAAQPEDQSFADSLSQGRGRRERMIWAEMEARNKNDHSPFALLKGALHGGLSIRMERVNDTPTRVEILVKGPCCSHMISIREKKHLKIYSLI